MSLDTLKNIIINGNEGFALTNAYKNNHRYYTDFINMMSYFCDNLCEKDYQDIERKFLSAANLGDIQGYLQTVTELTVLYYVTRNYLDDFKYEPKYNGKSNPECSFTHKGKTINIEVKCPDMSKRMKVEQHDTLKLHFSERISNPTEIIEDLKNIINPRLSNTEYSEIEELPRMDNKLKDYLESAQKKFPTGDNYFNILVIALDILSDADEWYNYIFDNNGVFTKNSFVKTNYEKVDALLISTPVCGHRSWEVQHNNNVWKLEETLNLLLLDPRKESSSEGIYYVSEGIRIFGDLTSGFLNYQLQLDETKTVSTTDTNFLPKYLEFKETELRIVSDYIQYLKNNAHIK